MRHPQGEPPPAPGEELGADHGRGVQRVPQAEQSRRGRRPRHTIRPPTTPTRSDQAGRPRPDSPNARSGQHEGQQRGGEGQDDLQLPAVARPPGSRWTPLVVGRGTSTQSAMYASQPGAAQGDRATTRATRTVLGPRPRRAPGRRTRHPGPVVRGTPQRPDRSCPGGGRGAGGDGCRRGRVAGVRSDVRCAQSFPRHRRGAWGRTLSRPRSRGRAPRDVPDCRRCREVHSGDMTLIEHPPPADVPPPTGEPVGPGDPRTGPACAVAPRTAWSPACAAGSPTGSTST